MVRSLFSSTGDTLLSDSKYFVIDGATRTITPPSTFNNFGVESDEKTNRIWFECPRIVGDNIDLTTLNLRVNYQNANAEKDQYLVDDVTVYDDKIHFSWLLSRKCTMYKGSVMFLVCAVKTDSAGVITSEWNTSVASGTVLEGLEVDAPTIPEDITDVVSQLLDIVNTAKTDLETAKVQAVASVEAAESKAVESIQKAPNNFFANAVKGRALDAAVRLDDVSPVEHELKVKVHSKNLCDFSGSGVKNGLTYSYENGYWTVQGTPSVTYAGIVSSNITNILEDGETYTISQSHYFSGSAAEGAIYLQCLVEDYDGNQLFFLSVVNPRSFTVDKSKYKKYILTLQCGTALQEVSVSNFAVQLEKGDTATSYTPHVDPTSVVLSRCGKNLLTTPYSHGNSREHNGITFSVNQNGSVKVEGTATAAAWFTLSEMPFATIIPRFWDRTARQDCSYNAENHVTSIFVNAGETVNKTYYPQIEIGDTVSGFAKGTELNRYTPTTNGMVENVNSIGADLTLLTDTYGTLIECEYNCDTNKVIGNLLKRITTLEGT